MELVVVSVISVIGAILGIIMLDRSYFKRLAWKRDFETEMFRLKKRESRKDKKLAAEIQTTPDKGIGELIRGLDVNKVKNILSMVQDGEQLPEEEGDIVSTLTNFASKNPELVSGLLQGLNQGAKNDSGDNVLFKP